MVARSPKEHFTERDFFEGNFSLSLSLSELIHILDFYFIFDYWPMSKLQMNARTRLRLIAEIRIEPNSIAARELHVKLANWPTQPRSGPLVGAEDPSSP